MTNPINAIPEGIVPTVKLTSGFAYPQVTFGAGGVSERIPFERLVDLFQAAHRAGIRSFDIGNYNGMPGRQTPSSADVIIRAALDAAGIGPDDYLREQKIWTWHYPLESLKDQLKRHFFRGGVDRAAVGVIGSLYQRDHDIAAIVGEIGQLIAEGWLETWSINNWPAAAAHEAFVQAAAQGVRPPEFTQLAYNVFRRSIPEGQPYRQVYLEDGLSPQASVVFEYGLLSGNETTSTSSSGPLGVHGRVPEPVRDLIRPKLPQYYEAARALGGTPSQLALAWVLTQPGTVPLAIIGFSSLEQLADDLGAYRLLETHGPEQIRAAVEDFAVDLKLTNPNLGVHADPDKLTGPKPVAATR